MGSWFRTRTRTQLTAFVLGFLFLVRAAAHVLEMLPLSPVRAWTWLMLPFNLIVHLEHFWLEVAIIVAGMLLIMWSLRDWSFRSVMPLVASIVLLDLFAVLASDAILVVGTRSVASTLQLSVEPTSWGLLGVDALSFLLWNVTTLGTALILVLLLGQLAPGRRGEQRHRADGVR